MKSTHRDKMLLLSFTALFEQLQKTYVTLKFASKFFSFGAYCFYLLTAHHLNDIIFSLFFSGSWNKEFACLSRERDKYFI